MERKPERVGSYPMNASSQPEACWCAAGVGIDGTLVMVSSNCLCKGSPWGVGSCGWPCTLILWARVPVPQLLGPKGGADMLPLGSALDAP